MNKKILFSLFFAFILRGVNVQAQDPVFSQFYASPLQLNPAFTGNAYAPFIALNYRMQYPAFNNNGAAYSTFAASYDQSLNGLNSGLGLSLMTDDAGQGIYRKTYASAHYSYKVNINKDMAAKIGVEAGFIQSNLDWNKLVFGDQLDPFNGASGPNGVKNPSNEVRPDRLNRTIFDLSTGFVVYGSGFHAGLSAKHLTSPNEGFINANQNLRIGLPTRWTVHGGYEFVISKATRYRQANFITPTAMYVKQGDFSQLVAGAYAGIGPLITGVWYRHANTNAGDAIVMVGFKQDYFKVGYSYDYSLGTLVGKTGGSHEVSLTINLDPYVGKKVDINDCFKMFR
jgi:type IX secretion system PorP/SprF family membrane protein